MTRGRVGTAIISGLAATATGLGVWAGTATATPGHAGRARLSSATASQAAATVPIVFNCRNQRVTRPATYVLTCGDGNTYLSGLSFAAWTANEGAASGTEEKNDCQPTCAGGTFRSYPAVVIFWRSEPLPKPKKPVELYFTRVTVLYPGVKPPIWSNGKMVAGPQTWTGSLPK